MPKGNSWLQRSRTALTTTRAPAERNVCGDDWKVGHVSLPWSEEEPFENRAFYKHFVTYGTGKRLVGPLILSVEAACLAHEFSAFFSYCKQMSQFVDIIQLVCT